MGIANLSLAYTDGMKMILAVFVALMFVACSSPETENLKKENSDLKTQLQTITRERDALKVQLDGIKAVLENATGSTAITPDPSATTPIASDSSSTPDPSTPDSSMGSGNPSDSNAPAPSNTPSSDGTGVTPPQANPNTGVSAVETYAKEVLETAQKFNSETQQTPPTDCSSGYTAGTHAVSSSDAVQSCRVDRVDGGFRVTLKDANGAITTLPTP